MADKLNELIDELCSKSYSHILVMGDINYINRDWETCTSGVRSEKKFLKCITDNYVHQQI